MAILTQDFPPAPGGMNTALAQQEIDDTEARYLQDILVDYPGIARRRGPVRAATGPAALPRPGSGLAIAVNPAGDDRYAALTGTGAAGYFTVWSSDMLSTTDLSWPHVLPTDPASGASTRYRLFSATPGLSGGTWVGAAADYGATSPNHGLAYWKGGTKADYTTGTITLTRGSATVTGSGTSWTSNVVPGMFLFANTDDAGAGTFTATYIGSVLSVNSDTSITLEKVSPYSGSAGRSYTLTSLRGFIPRVAKGRITSDTASTTVSGGATKFSAQGLATGTWNLYRARDLTWIGKVASVQSDISLTLAANAAVALADDSYIAIRGDWSTNDKSVDITLSTNKTGWLTGVYAERQWYANNGAQFDKTFRVWFSDPGDSEVVDLSDDGDWIPISSTSDIPESIRCLMPTYNAMLVLKESETFAIYGSSPDSFSAKKIEDDGTLSTMSVQPYGGGAIWAGRNGIYFYDGVSVQNLTDQKLGDVWKNSVRTVDTTRYRMWSMMARNHYLLFIENIDPTVEVKKGNTVSTPSHWVVCINMESRAITLLTNVGIRGSVVLPAAEGRGTRFLVNDTVGGVGKLCEADDLFDTEAVDSLTTVVGGVAGPDFYFETKKFNAGEDLRLKRFKQLAVHYLAQGGALNVDTVLGLNTVGRTLNSTLPASVLTWDTLRVLLSNWNAVAAEYPSWDDMIIGVLRAKRVRFLKKSQHVSFRIWQENLTMPRVRVGPFEIGFKQMRPGRVS